MKHDGVNMDHTNCRVDQYGPAMFTTFPNGKDYPIMGAMRQYSLLYSESYTLHISTQSLAIV